MNPFLEGTKENIMFEFLPEEFKQIYHSETKEEIEKRTEKFIKDVDRELLEHSYLAALILMIKSVLKKQTDINFSSVNFTNETFLLTSLAILKEAEEEMVSS
ncbi:hypothetical protein LCGC14_1341560 [marine sediment metagenome]|uniref:Uncharacterized protein n=1 Tax=marine sediment metagenome TaxID=412755 RepID=A0A0F9L008_9ZZZZ